MAYQVPGRVRMHSPQEQPFISGHEELHCAGGESTLLGTVGAQNIAVSMENLGEPTNRTSSLQWRCMDSGRLG